LLAAAWAALALLAASCKSGRHEAPLPRHPAVVDVSLREYRFEYKPPASSGRVVFQVQNAGRREHELVLVPLPEGMPSLTQQLHSEQRRAVKPLAFLQPLRPGTRGVFAVDLQRGRYGMVSFVKDAKGVLDATKGMASEFRVR